MKKKLTFLTLTELCFQKQRKREKHFFLFCLYDKTCASETSKTIKTLSTLKSEAVSCLLDIWHMLYRQTPLFICDVLKSTFKIYHCRTQGEVLKPGKKFRFSVIYCLPFQCGSAVVVPYSYSSLLILTVLSLTL